MADNRDKLRCYMSRLESVKHIHSQILRLREIAVEAENLRREKDLALESLKSIQELNRKTILRRDALIEQSKMEAEKTRKRLSRMLNNLKTERAHYKNRVETLSAINERLTFEMKKHQKESAAKERLLERLRADHERVREALVLLNAKYEKLEKQLNQNQSRAINRERQRSSSILKERDHENQPCHNQLTVKDRERREDFDQERVEAEKFSAARIRKSEVYHGSHIADIPMTREVRSTPDRLSSISGTFSLLPDHLMHLPREPVVLMDNPSHSPGKSQSPGRSVFVNYENQSDDGPGTYIPNEVETDCSGSGSNTGLEVICPEEPIFGNLEDHFNDSPARTPTQSDSDHCHKRDNASFDSAEPSLYGKSSEDGCSSSSEYCQCPPEPPKLKQTASRISNRIKGFFKRKSNRSLNASDRSKEDVDENESGSGSGSGRRLRIEEGKTFALTKRDIETLASNCAPLERTSGLTRPIESGEPILFSVRTPSSSEKKKVMTSNNSSRSSLCDVCNGDFADNNSEGENISEC